MCGAAQESSGGAVIMMVSSSPCILCDVIRRRCADTYRKVVVEEGRGERSIRMVWLWSELFAPQQVDLSGWLS